MPKKKSDPQWEIVGTVDGPVEELLIIGLSGRMLAQSARRGGWEPVVIDQFADQDTGEFSKKVYKLDFNRLKNDRKLLQSITRGAERANGKMGLVYGSGIDHRIGGMGWFFKDFMIYGNSLDTLRTCYDPKKFFTLLDRLSIPFPEVSYCRPNSNRGWLVKSSRGEGGGSVRFVGEQPVNGQSPYYQKFIPGQVLSALFLANRTSVKIVGFNTQWHSNQGAAHPFRFSGVINRADLSLSEREAVTTYIRRLVSAIGLRGLNSLDFILDRGICKIIELNPRPSASIALYDEDYPQGLITEHIGACKGTIKLEQQKESSIRALKVVISPSQISIPRSISWPGWTADRPYPGISVLPGQPICSVTATGSCRTAVEKKIEAREMQVLGYFPAR